MGVEGCGATCAWAAGFAGGNHLVGVGSRKVAGLGYGISSPHWIARPSHGNRTESWNTSHKHHEKKKKCTGCTFKEKKKKRSYISLHPLPFAWEYTSAHSASGKCSYVKSVPPLRRLVQYSLLWTNLKYNLSYSENATVEKIWPIKWPVISKRLFIA